MNRHRRIPRARRSRLEREFRIAGHTILGPIFERRHPGHSIVDDRIDLDLLPPIEDDPCAGGPADPNFKFYGMHIVAKGTNQISFGKDVTVKSVPQEFYLFGTPYTLYDQLIHVPNFYRVTGTGVLGKLEVEGLKPGNPHHTTLMNLLRDSRAEIALADVDSVDKVESHFRKHQR